MVTGSFSRGETNRTEITNESFGFFLFFAGKVTYAGLFQAKQASDQG